MGFPGGADGRESVCSAEDLSSTSGLERSPGEGNGYPLQYSCLENSMDRESHGQRRQAGYRQWSCKQWDTTEQLTFSLFLGIHLGLSQQCRHFMKTATSKRMLMLFVFSIFSLQKLLKIEKYCVLLKKSSL